MSFRVNPAPAPSNCSECFFLPDCGGLDGEDFAKGCFQRCSTRCRDHPCDCVCPLSSIGFDEAWEDVGGICIPPEHCQQRDNNLLPPFYVAQIIRGTNRCEPFDARWASVPLTSILSFSKKGCDVRFESKEQLCDALKVSINCHIILSCVAPDAIIEAFWADHRERSLLQRIAALGFWAATVPNFSFMLDTPRTNSLYNLSRIFRLTERMSKAEINTIPHINASTLADWKKWETVLKMIPNIRLVAMEFQTGLSKAGTEERIRGERFLQNLDRLQEAIGRRLHPIVEGGAGWMAQFASICDTFTAIDSTPYMKTVHWQVAITVSGQRRPRWQTSHLPHGISLHGRLVENVEAHRRMVLQNAGLPVDDLLVQPRLI